MYSNSGPAENVKCIHNHRWLNWQAQAPQLADSWRTPALALFYCIMLIQYNVPLVIIHFPKSALISTSLHKPKRFTEPINGRFSLLFSLPSSHFHVSSFFSAFPFIQLHLSFHPSVSHKLSSYPKPAVFDSLVRPLCEEAKGVRRTLSHGSQVHCQQCYLIQKFLLMF